jgi:hypothetical protein
MDDLIKFILKNSSWLFSGVLIAVPIAIISWFISKRGNTQKQIGGDSSINLQAGSSININREKGHD